MRGEYVIRFHIWLKNKKQCTPSFIFLFFRYDFEVRKCIVANWKEYPTTEAGALALARASDFEGMIICPPHRFLGLLNSGSLLKHAALGAQDYVSDAAGRGVRYVIIGHSDRRRLGDTNDSIAEKMARAVSDGLTPILCVGETREERERGKTEAAIREQLKIGLSKIQKSAIRNPKSEIWIVYEPVWAISTEAHAQPETAGGATRIICFIKEQLIQYKDSRFLYGGSVNAENAHLFLEQRDIDGLLVGAASLHKEEIEIIWQLAQQTKKNS